MGIIADYCTRPRHHNCCSAACGGDSVTSLPNASPEPIRGHACVVIAASETDGDVDRCLESVREHTRQGVPILTVPPTAGAVNGALAQSAPADVVILAEPCRVSAGWLTRLEEAAHADTNTATASALAVAGGALALCDSNSAARDVEELAEHLDSQSLRLRPRLQRAVGPCVYVRREALELVGALDETLPLPAAIELDLTQRCLLSGLAHVAADDVVVERLRKVLADSDPSTTPELRERYPYLADQPSVASAPNVLTRALEAARPRSRLSVTIDARALDGAVTGTHVHIVELIRALAQTGALRLRVLVRAARIDRQTLELLRRLSETELLSEERIDDATPLSAIVHRPQQTFAAEDVELALRLGQRLVLSQLDLIAYDNPGYFPDAAAWRAFRRASRHGISAADRVVVFSDHTRRELLADALVDQERIRIVPPGLDHEILDEVQPEPLVTAIRDLNGGGSRPYLLCLGTDFRHKNRVFSLRLLSQLLRTHRWDGRLVLAGTHIPHGSSRALEQELLEKDPPLREAVVDLGPVSEPERLWLMRHAAAVVYPSVYEGFGLVPFEAALSGVPCAFAAQSALAETAPPGTATIVPWDPAESATAVHALLTDASARAVHVDALANAARGLTWANTANAIVHVYGEAAQAPVRDAATLGRDAVDRERELTAAHETVIRRLIGEREDVQRAYDMLNVEVGSGLSLIGPHGSLPDNVQRALLTLSAHPALGRPVYGAVAQLFAALRSLNRLISKLLGRLH
jgi:glycosyltransferase involved in cell wall biosynthesis